MRMWSHSKRKKNKDILSSYKDMASLFVGQREID